MTTIDHNSKLDAKAVADDHSATYSVLPHRITQVLLLIVFPLIWVGGLVTTSDAGMAVPDWPNTYNYNMFAYPVRDWFFGPWDLFVEHGHRLLGSLAGIVSIALVAVTYLKEERRWLRWVALLLLLFVILQGILGGVRVVLSDRVVAQIHGTVGPGFFCFVAMVAVMNSRWWHQWSDRVRSELSDPPVRFGMLLKFTSLTMLIASYFQLGLGAAIRHTPEVSTHRYFEFVLYSHLVIAGVVAAIGVFVLGLAMLKPSRKWGSRRTSIFLSFLVLIQVGLGLTTWVVKYGWPAWLGDYAFAAHYTVPEKSFWQVNLVTAHVAVGSLILATSGVLTIRTFRLFGKSHAPQNLS